MFQFLAGAGTVRGQTVGPFASLVEARSYVRNTGLNANMTGHLTVLVAAGSSDTFAWDIADSGTNGFRVIYQSTTLGGHRVHASRVVTGWSVFAGHVYRAFVGAGLSIHTMWEDGARARKARFPKLVVDPSYPLAQAPYLADEGVLNSHTVLQYQSGALSPGSWDLAAAAFRIWSGGHIDWFTDDIPIASLNLGARQFTLGQNSRYVLNDGSGSRWVVMGVLDLLTEAGEFFYHPTTGYLYYWPAAGGAPGTIEIPTAKRVVEFVGPSESSLVQNIEMRGFLIEQSDFTDWYRFAEVNAGEAPPPAHTYPQYDRVKSLVQNRQGLVYMENARGCRVTRCHLRQAGYSAFFLNNYNQRHYLADNWIEHIGHSAYYIDGRYPGEGDVNKDCVIFNNKIRNVGELVGHGAGAWIFNAGGHTFANCDIADGPRNAWFVGAGVTDIPVADMYCRNNMLAYTKIARMCQDSGDVGAVGIGGLSSLGVPYVTNYLRQVTIDSIFAHPSMTDTPPHGVFFDNASWGQNAANVQVTNTQGTIYQQAGDSGGHTVSNVSWGTFDPALMDTKNIGLTSEFPY